MASKKYGSFYRFRVWLHCYWLVTVETFLNIANNIGCYKYRKFARLPDSLDGKIVLITGANTGIGKETAKEVVSKGARVIMACRDEGRAKKAIEDIVKELGREELSKNFSIVLMNLSDLDTVRTAAEQINRQFTHLDVLINNAGVMNTPEWTTTQGHEFQFGTNHLGHFLLTNLLLDKLKAAPSGARIVHVSALLLYLGDIHFENVGLTGIYTPMDGYARSKLANQLFNRELAKRLQGSGVHSYAIHPGIIRTELSRHFGSLTNRIMNVTAGVLLNTIPEGAQTQLYCAFDERVAQQSGHYYSNCQMLTDLPAHAQDDADAAKLWDLSLQLCGLDDKKLPEKMEADKNFPGNNNSFRKNNKIDIIEIV